MTRYVCPVEGCEADSETEDGLRAHIRGKSATCDLHAEAVGADLSPEESTTQIGEDSPGGDGRTSRSAEADSEDRAPDDLGDGDLADAPEGEDRDEYTEQWDSVGETGEDPDADDDAEEDADSGLLEDLPVGWAVVVGVVVLVVVVLYLSSDDAEAGTPDTSGADEGGESDGAPPSGPQPVEV